MNGSPANLAALMRDERYYAYVFDKSVSGSAEDTGLVNFDADSFFALMGISGNATGNYRAKLSANSNIALQNKKIQADNFIGTAQQPNLLSKPHLFQPSGSLLFELTNMIGSTNTIQVVLHGLRIFKPAPQAKDFAAVFFQYSTDRQSLSANQQLDVPLQIENDADFYVYKVVAKQTGTFQGQIYDNASKDPWHSALVNNANFAGTAALPYLLPKRRRIPAGTVMNVKIKDTSGSSNTVEVVLEGFKLFKV